MTRQNLATVRLPDGRVLVIGGEPAREGEPRQEVDVIDPDKLTVEPFAPLNLGRMLARAVALPDGRVVVGQGFTRGKGETPSAEIYDPASKRWRLIRGLGQREVQAPLVAALPGGKVLIAGGDLAWKGAMSQDSFVVDVASGKVTPTGPLPGAGGAWGFYRYDKQGAVVWAAEARDETATPSGQDCDLSFDPGKNSWTDTRDCRPADLRVTRYPDASGKASLFGHRAVGELVRYENNAWKAVMATPHRQVGAGLYDAITIDAHRVVGVDAVTGDALVCAL